MAGHQDVRMVWRRSDQRRRVDPLDVQHAVLFMRGTCRFVGRACMTIPPRFPITAAEIDKVVAVFYARIRQHAALGEVFAAHVTDWPEHEIKIASFWRNAILMERSYSGNPMRKHMAAGNVHGAHFPQWLAVFDEVLRDTVTAD